jgi:cytochrome oxidase assembly protein ShyY1
MVDEGRQFIFDPEWRISLFTALLVPLMVFLGFWQLQRADEKAALADAWEQRRQQPPAPLDKLWSVPGDSLAYRPVQFTGRFLQDEYFLLDNRIHDGRFGYEVLGILQLAERSGFVLVNRGWLAGDPARLVQPRVPVVGDRVTVSGHVYVAPGAPYLLAEQKLGEEWPKLLQAVEMDKLVPLLEGELGARVFPYHIRIGAAQAGALTVDWQVVNVSPEKHRGYAVQWFTMALFLTLFYLLRCTNLWQLVRGPRESRK